MEITENGRLYIKNYYVLDQTRNEVHQYLENLANNFSNLVNENIKLQNNDPFIFKKYIKKGGGRVEIYLDVKKIPDEISYIGDKIKFNLIYSDVITSNNISSPTKCKIYGYSPKNNSKLISEVRRISTLNNIKNPYDELEMELVEKQFDDTTKMLAKEFISRHDAFIKIMNILIEEQNNK